MKYPKLLALTLSTAFLAACGGGGDSSTSSFPLDAAYTKVLTTGASLNGTAVDGADTWTLSLSSAAAADEAFEGVVSKKAIQSLTIKKNGVVLVATTISNYFSINPPGHWKPTRQAPLSAAPTASSETRLVHKPVQRQLASRLTPTAMPWVCGTPSA